MASKLVIGKTYSWKDLGPRFGFEPAYFGVAGGMVPSSKTGELLLITHPGGGKSFDYGDEWDGDELIYVGKGTDGDQKRTGNNLDVAENRRSLLVFENVGPRALKFLGQAQCVEETSASAPGKSGMRKVLQFRLKFDEKPPKSKSSQVSKAAGSKAKGLRPFVASEVPKAPAPGETPTDPAEKMAKLEKAVLGHHEILVTLADYLEKRGYKMSYMPTAIDLLAERSGRPDLIVEAKTLSASNELTQTRSGFAQLFEYRLEHPKPEKVELVLAVNQELNAKRQKLLSQLGVAAVLVYKGHVSAANTAGSKLLSALPAAK